MRVLGFAALAIIAVFPASLSWGQNLVLNPTFETDVTGWAPLSTASIEWTGLDADGDPTSGSALVTNFSTSALDSTGAVQCLDGIIARGDYSLAADILVPGGQSETGRAHLLVQWYDEPGCTGGQLGGDVTPGVYTSTPDAWYTDLDAFQAPSGTRSARVRLSVYKYEDSGTLQAHFDNIVFEAVIFVDGFESGDTTSWSNTVP